MTRLDTDKNRLAVRAAETSGPVHVYAVPLAFSPIGTGWPKRRCSGQGASVSVLTDGGQDSCAVPREVLQLPGRVLYIGVYGTRGGSQTRFSMPPFEAL